MFWNIIEVSILVYLNLRKKKYLEYIYIKEKYKESSKFKMEQPNIKQEDIWVGFIKKCVREKYSCDLQV